MFSALMKPVPVSLSKQAKLRFNSWRISSLVKTCFYKCNSSRFFGCYDYKLDKGYCVLTAWNFFSRSISVIRSHAALTSFWVPPFSRTRRGSWYWKNDGPGTVSITYLPSWSFSQGLAIMKQSRWCTAVAAVEVLIQQSSSLKSRYWKYKQNLDHKHICKTLEWTSSVLEEHCVAQIIQEFSCQTPAGKFVAARQLPRKIAAETFAPATLWENNGATSYVKFYFNRQSGHQRVKYSSAVRRRSIQIPAKPQNQPPRSMTRLRWLIASRYLSKLTHLFRNCPEIRRGPFFSTPICVCCDQS